jgi:branched-chain amino acid transport system substrate-binding protein
MNPDVIFAPGNYTESALIAKQARELGITVPFLGGDTWETPELITVGRENVEGVVFSSFFDETAATDGIAKLFVDEYRKMYGADKEIAAVSALGFDGYRVALDAIARANSTDTKVIRDAVAATKDFDGATGKITFDANGDATKDAYIKTVENGKFKFLTIVEP